MIKIQNRFVTKLALLLLPSLSCFQFARADIDLGCTTAEGNTPNGVTVTYQTGSGVTVNQSGTGTSYSYQPDGNPGHQFFTITTNAPNGNSATTTIDSASGLMRGRSEAHNSVTPGTNDQMSDDLTFHNSSSQPASVTLHWHVDGTMTVSDTPGGTRAVYIAVLQFYSGGAGGSLTQSAQLNTDPSGNSDSYTPDGWDDPGESYQIQHNAGGLYGYSFTATVVVPKGDSTWHLYMRLTTGVNSSGSLTGFGVSDFSNTSALTFDVPSGVSFTSPSGTLSAGSRLLNISTRAKVLGSDSAAIAGFIVTGNVAKKVIIRGIGPSLSSFFGAANVLANPTLELKQGDTTLTTNDDWKDTQQTEIQNSGLAPSDQAEAAIIRTLNPGSYTAILRGKNDGTGLGVVEVYDLDATADAKLANISTRSFVDAEPNVLIGGIIGGGNGSQPNVLIRAIGPSLTGFGVPNALQDPLLELHDKDGNLIATNDDWQSDQKDAIQNTGLAPANAKESAILATLLPTNYTAIVKGVNETTGVALVEVYHLE